MLFYKITKILVLAGLVVSATSCVKDQDFDQADAITVTPELEADLVYLKLTQDNFLNSNGEVEVSFVSQTTDLKFLRDGFVQNDLTRIDFTFNTENSFRQSFNTVITFLNENGDPTYEFTFFVPSADADGVPVNATHVEVIQGEDLELFKDALRLQVGSSIILSESPIKGELNFESKARLYFEFN